MLAGLRLDRFIRCDHQQNQVYATDSRQHVADETLVAGDVDKTDSQNLAVRQRQLQVREPDVNGDAAALFLFQAVGVDPGESLYQRGLSVVYVPGGADDNGSHSGQYRRCKRSVSNGPRALLFHLAAMRQ